MAEAMAQVRAELGAEAIILEQRRTRHGVEITAALEPDEPLLIQPIPSMQPMALPPMHGTAARLPPISIPAIR